MITDAIIGWWQQILSFFVSLIPDAPIIAAGNGAASGSACCAQFLIGSLVLLFQTTITGAGPLIADIRNNPIVLVIDFSVLGFVVGCLLSFMAVFFILRILITLWQQVKW